MLLRRCFSLSCTALFLCSPASGQTCNCVAPDNPEFESGIIWQGIQEPNITEIAQLVAPILWYSSDEPLLLEGKGPLPNPHPCDPDQRGPVVYYQLHRVFLSGDSRVSLPVENDPEFWSKVERLTIRFYFYYFEDRGIGSHYHDLEVAEFEVMLEKTTEGCRRIRLYRVIGFAHGLDWYNNELEIQADTRFPITLLIEEGKHASCPDRNADGTYTPGYDVNRRVNDAWGLRDVAGSGYLGSSGFKASMVKQREFEYRVGPNLNQLACSNIRNSSLARSNKMLARYDLRSAYKVPACTDMGPEGQRLNSMMSDHKFGPDYPPKQRPTWGLKDLAEPLTYRNSWLPPIAFRRDRGFALGISLPAAELGQFGYLVPRINFVPDRNDVSVEGMLAPSAAQFFSWYVSSGAAYERELIDDPEYGKQPWGKPNWNFVSEIGIKFRTRVSGKWRILSFGYHFAGIRIGFRNSGFDDFKNSRIVFEVGAGIF